MELRVGRSSRTVALRDLRNEHRITGDAHLVRVGLRVRASEVHHRPGENGPDRIAMVVRDRPEVRPVAAVQHRAVTDDLGDHPGCALIDGVRIDRDAIEHEVERA